MLGSVKKLKMLWLKKITMMPEYGPLNAHIVSISHKPKGASDNYINLSIPFLLIFLTLSQH